MQRLLKLVAALAVLCLITTSCEQRGPAQPMPGPEGPAGLSPSGPPPAEEPAEEATEETEENAE